MERGTELPADQFDDPTGAPEIGAKAVVGRLLGQPGLDLGFLVRGEKSRPSRRRPGGQTLLAGGAVPGHPLGEGYGMNPKPRSDGRLSLALQNPGGRLSSQRFQYGSRSFASHRRVISYTTERINNFTYARISRNKVTANMAANYLCTIPDVAEEVLSIRISDPQIDESGYEYFCIIQIIPLESEPYTIYGVDAIQASHLARHFLVTRFQEMKIQNTSGQTVDSKEFYGI